MTWGNHKICNIAMIYAFSGDLKATLVSTLGSILPDILEISGLFPHRSHFFE